MLFFVLTTLCVTPEQLGSLPNVAEVSVSGPSDAQHRVVHILDWHYIPEKLFRIDTPDGDYDEFLNSVEKLQAEEMDFIRALKIDEVFLEGLTDKSLSHFTERVETLRRFKPPAGDDPVSVFVSAIRREDELQLGAPGRMLIAREINAVRPADDIESHAAANPHREGRLVFDAKKNRAREQAIAKRLLRVKEAVVVLGGDHDLSAHLPNAQYIRVTLGSYGAARRSSHDVIEGVP